ncbi:SdrD B-like domain-containing protein [Chryseobacterium sp. SC28]|uniref:SdrD B-like domain-containing protein n=1 Tax=Chryseobacterium sp. SC28 TaxID=2268028 RepID=UPI000F64F92F|nr:SdrD B-like domain-containing protein [Chryseobacterium sp. SC28]RRQ45830.1 hypothetical protein DTW91_07885 [Chryseobacterium sp. SC28]
MKKIIYLLLLIPAFLFSQSANEVTQVYTDYNGYWTSSKDAISTTKPDNSHNLLAIRWNGTVISTGVNDAILTANGQTFTPRIFNALPVNFMPAPSSSSYIGVGYQYGGSGSATTPNPPVTNNLNTYLVDGTNGLNLGTAIYNLPASSEINYVITSINPGSIGDGIPDFIVTQVGDISGSNDTFRVTDASNNVIGTPLTVGFSSVSVVATQSWKFYQASVTPPSFVSSLAGTRNLRVMAFDWSDFGITAANYTQVRRFVQIFSGASDSAFTAYSQSSMTVYQAISGTIYNDNDAGTPSGNGYNNATVQLLDSGNNVIATSTTDTLGNYVFPNTPPGNYTVRLVVPSGFVVVGNAAGNTNNTLPASISETASASLLNFGINQPPVANNDNITTTFNNAVTHNILSNDTDPNSGTVIATSVNLTPPVGASSIVTDGSGNVKGFTIAAQGTWLVNTSGVLTFTPTIGFSGNPTTVTYSIKDNAGLISSAANISITVFAYCFKTPASTVGGLPTIHGITSLGRAGDDGDGNPANDWPMVRKGAWTALESKTKGFVLNRLTSTQIANIPPANRVKGMMVYDITNKCLSIFNGISWQCFSTQTCPNIN